jgi:hypothetical protein
VELPNNIIKHYLKNVFFISGSACGGKTTIAKRLSAKYKITLYNWDERFSQHKVISDPIHQPFMNKEWASWEERFNLQPTDQSISNSILEQAKISIIELLTISQEQPIIAEGIFNCNILEKISDRNKVVFLMADMQAVRTDFFFRTDKLDMLQCIETLKDPELAKENTFQAIEYNLKREIESVKKSGFWYHIRGISPDWERITEAVERQLELS